MKLSNGTWYYSRADLFWLDINVLILEVKLVLLCTDFRTDDFLIQCKIDCSTHYDRKAFEAVAHCAIFSRRTNQRKM